MRDDAECLRAIIKACDTIAEYVDGVDYKTFLGRGLIVDGCAMQCLIVGNYCRLVSEDLKAMYPNVQWRNAYAFRNRVGHVYGTSSFDTRILWETVTKDIPRLRDECAAILHELVSVGPSPNIRMKKRPKHGFLGLRR